MVKTIKACPYVIDDCQANFATRSSLVLLKTAFGSVVAVFTRSCGVRSIIFCSSTVIPIIAYFFDGFNR